LQFHQFLSIQKLLYDGEIARGNLGTRIARISETTGDTVFGRKFDGGKIKSNAEQETGLNHGGAEAQRRTREWGRGRGRGRERTSVVGAAAGDSCNPDLLAAVA
jgi:hypothetical protein